MRWDIFFTLTWFVFLVLFFVRTTWVDHTRKRIRKHYPGMLRLCVPYQSMALRLWCWSRNPVYWLDDQHKGLK